MIATCWVIVQPVPHTDGSPDTPFPEKRRPPFGSWPFRRDVPHFGPAGLGCRRRSVYTPQGNPRIRLALLMARRTAPHCLREPLLSELIIRGSVGSCPLAWRRFAMRQTSSFSNCSRSCVLCFWHRRYRDRIARQRSGHFSVKCETDKLSCRATLVSDRASHARHPGLL